MALTEKQAREAITFIDSIIEQIPDDVMFLAFCCSCGDVRKFQYGRCLECKNVWNAIEKYLARPMPQTS